MAATKTGESRFAAALRKAFTSVASIAPMLLGVIGLVGLFQAFITPEMLGSLFGHNDGLDTLTGTLAGGVSVGQPFLSYVIGGELLGQGVSLYAVSAFILSFVTLGVVQIPLELSLFGLRFTIARNLLALVFTPILALATVATLDLLS